MGGMENAQGAASGQSDPQASPYVADNAAAASESAATESANETATAPAPVAFPEHATATVRRGVNMRGFLALGVVVGVVLAIVLTYAFPPHPDFSRGQVLGFLLVFVTAVSAIVFIGIGAIIEFVIGRNKREIELQKADR